MKIRPYRQVEAEEETPGVKMRTVIGPRDGAPHFAMRVFDVQPGASSPLHKHQWEHEVFVVAGQGVVKDATGEHPFKAEDVIYIAPGEQHSLINTGQSTLRFVCCIPMEKK